MILTVPDQSYHLNMHGHWPGAASQMQNPCLTNQFISCWAEDPHLQPHLQEETSSPSVIPTRPFQGLPHHLKTHQRRQGSGSSCTHDAEVEGPGAQEKVPKQIQQSCKEDYLSPDVSGIL